MTDLDLQHALGRAVEWAREAGDIAVSRLGTDFSVRRKDDRSLVTEVDVQMQRSVTDHISREFPSHGIIAEEADGHSSESHHSFAGTDKSGLPAQSEYCWVIDPLDGTRNYFRGLSSFCVSIALMRAGQPVAGVIHDPMAKEDYTAVRGGGAFLDETRLSSSPREWDEDTLLGIPSAKRAPWPDAIVDVWLKRGTLRNFGSTCLHLALTAAGRFDGCYAQTVKLWDLAAGALLVQEAGGRITTPTGDNIFPIDPKTYQGEDLAFLAGGLPIHSQLLKSLRQPGL